MAIQNGYPIVPFGAVGAEDILDIVVDEGNTLFSAVHDVVQKATGWPMQPLVRGIGPTAIPRPERLYFSFGEPIPTAGYADDDLTKAARRVRDQVKREVERQLEFLFDKRDRDPKRRFSRRILPGVLS
jgi:1-acyl-sn-glycerol-3-phosphate acyltransferase